MSSMIESLLRPGAFPGCAQAARLIETHISWVLLAGEFAYKIKKPVNLGFLDYSTPARRHRFCEEELRVNRRYAPQLYLDVVAITAGDSGAEIAGSGPVLDHAVRMRRFPDDALLSEVVARGPVDIALWHQLGVDVAAVHAELPHAGPEYEDGRGTPPQLRDAVHQNFRQTRPFLRRDDDIALLNRLEELAWVACKAHERRLWERYENGWVRECHGDLHLGNIVLTEGRAIAFDAIEFNPALSWIDLMNELAFLVMDCESRGVAEGGFVALNAWLEHTGDYAGLELLDFFCAYRAMVRAKVAALRVGRPPLVEGSPAHGECRRYLELTARYTGTRRPFLAITCGVSGSGKSTLAERLLGSARAIRVRSDVERKRLFGIPPQGDSRALPAGEGLYSAEASRRTFARLAQLARDIIGHGLPVIVDATFIQRAHRDDFRQLAHQLGVPFHILLCDAPRAELERRVRARSAARNDPSEADVDVLAAQLARAELPDPLTEPETLVAAGIDALTVEALSARLVRAEA